jgi:protein TonB
MRLWKGFLVSMALHAAFFGAANRLVAWRDERSRQVIDIDLSGSSLLLRPQDAASQGHAAPPPQPWILAAKGRFTPRPAAEAQPVSATPEPEAGPACPPPCPDNPGDWMPAAATSRKPAWAEGMITEDDYPQNLRSKGVEGKVVVDILIDATGAVESVKLVQGSEPEFNQLVLDRLKKSRFRPAYDQDGNPVACSLRMPLAFRLRD